MNTIWCLGMYASASTWLFNVVREIQLAAGQPARTHFFSGAADFGGFGGTDLVKSHEIDNEAAIIELAKRARKIFVTMRDPRDAVTSLMLYHGYEFAASLALVEKTACLCMGFARDRRTLFYRYERGFFETPETVGRIAAHLGIAITAARAREIFAGLTRPEVEKQIAALASLPGVLQDKKSGDRLDPRTHWHSHHAGRSGEAGRWRHMLNAAQAAQAALLIKNYHEFTP